MKKFLILICFIFFFQSNPATGQIQGRNWNQDQFRDFLAAFIKMDPNDQSQYVKESLTEYYFYDCQTLQREVMRDTLLKEKSYVLLNISDEMFSLWTVKETESKWRVVLTIGDTSISGLTYFEWDAEIKKWFLTGFEYGLPKHLPEECF